jgi:hypothetical protein
VQVSKLRKWVNFVSYVLDFTETVSQGSFHRRKMFDFIWLEIFVESNSLWGSGQPVLQPFVVSVPHSLQCRHWRAVPLHGFGIRILVRRNSCSAFDVNTSNVTQQVLSGLYHEWNQVMWHAISVFFVVVALRPNAGYGLPIHKLSRSHTTTHHSR